MGCATHLALFMACLRVVCCDVVIVDDIGLGKKLGYNVVKPAAGQAGGGRAASPQKTGGPAGAVPVGIPSAPRSAAPGAAGKSFELSSDNMRQLKSILDQLGLSNSKVVVRAPLPTQERNVPNPNIQSPPPAGSKVLRYSPAPRDRGGAGPVQTPGRKRRREPSKDIPSAPDALLRRPPSGEGAPPGKSRHQEQAATDTTISYVDKGTGSTDQHPPITTTVTVDRPFSSTPTIQIDTPISSALSSAPAAGIPDEPTSSLDLEVPNNISISELPNIPYSDQNKLQNFINSHNSNIEGASRARKGFFKMKIKESRAKRRNNATKLENLKKILGRHMKNINMLDQEMARMKREIGNSRSLLNNTKGTLGRLDSDIRDVNTQERLEEMEILKLNKLINDEKNKLDILRDKQNMYKNRVEKLSREKNTYRSALRSNESRLNVYRRYAEDLGKEIESIRENINEVEFAKDRDSDVLNSLEIEHGLPESDYRHLSLFVRHT